MAVARPRSVGAQLRAFFVPLAASRDARLAARAIAEAPGFTDINASDLPARARARWNGSSVSIDRATE